jgi:hypothetical protein
MWMLPNPKNHKKFGESSATNLNLNLLVLPTCKNEDYHQQHELDTPIIFQTKQIISMSPVFKVEMF